MITISVCVGTSCHLNGANNVVMSFRHLIEEYKLHDAMEVVAAFCTEACSRETVSVSVGEEKFAICAKDARSFFKEKVLPMVKR